MNQSDLYNLVQNAKQGDKDAMNQILVMFSPIIKKESNRAIKNERSDLQQHLNEKVIRAVHNYDMDSVPEIDEFVHLMALE